MLLSARRALLALSMPMALAACGGEQASIPAAAPPPASAELVEDPASPAAIERWTRAGPRCVPQSHCLSFGGGKCALVRTDGTIDLAKDPALELSEHRWGYGFGVRYGCHEGVCFHSVEAGHCISNFPNLPSYRCGLSDGVCKEVGSFMTPR